MSSGATVDCVLRLSLENLPIEGEDRPEAAEVAFTVADGWQGRGVGSFLLDALAERARENGITVFTAEMLASNHAMRALFEHLGDVRWADTGDAVLLAAAPVGPRGG